jgi:hypothetical protein
LSVSPRAHPDPEAAIPRQGAPEKGRDGHALLIGQDLDVGQAGGVIDGHVDILPADAADAAAAITRDAMPDPTDSTQFLDVQMHQRAGPLPLVAADGLGGLEGAQAIRPVALEYASDGRPTEPQGAGDLGAGPALPPQPHHPGDELGGRGGRLALRPTRAVLQARRPFGAVPAHPFADGSFADAERLRDIAAGLGAVLDALNQAGSTVRRGPGILVDVESRARGSWQSGDSR